MRSLPLLAAVALTGATLAAQTPAGGWPQHSPDRPMAPIGAPAVQRLPVAPPRGAIVLFDGTGLARWQRADGTPATWRLTGDGAMEVAPRTGDIRTREGFGDVLLHVEWATPSPAKGEGQNRGNSGVYLMATYEVQVLDSYQSRTYADGQAAAIYGQFPPSLNVSRPPGEWQSYDIEFRRPRFDAEGKLVSPARMTVRHNGVTVHDDVALEGPTSHFSRPPYRAHADALPVLLQDHGEPVRYRNIWVVPLGESR